MAATLCLAGAVRLTEPINRQRAELQLTYNPDTGHAIPADIALAQAALGSFRGLAVDFLWQRAKQMKQDGQYREANQLSRWICNLQPRFEGVWVFHAWNMAYNISVATHTPEERWDWVNKGVRLLRGEAIDANPNSVVLQKELAWIFFHKFGGMSDDMHWYYRRRLASEWQAVLGSTEGRTAEQIIQRMQDLVDAPDSPEVLFRHEDAARVAEKITSLGYELDDSLLRELGRIWMFAGSIDAEFYGFNVEQVSQMIDLRIYQVMRDKENHAGLAKVAAFLRKRVLLDQYNMDPAEMLRLMEDFGPMDWRHPAAHSAYWAQQGIQAAGRLRDDSRVDQINTDRLIILSMQQLFDTGRISYDPVSGRLSLLPDTRFFDAYEKALGFASDRAIGTDRGDRTLANYQGGHENFLLKATMYQYLYGDEQEARAIYEQARGLYGNDDDYDDRKYQVTLTEHVRRELGELGDLFATRSQFIDMLLRRAFLEGLTKSQPDVFNKFLQLANEAHRSYQAKQVETPQAGQARQRMEDFPEMVVTVYMTIMQDPALPLLTKGRIWRATDPRLLYRVYEPLQEALYRQIRQETEAGRSSFDPQRLFPRPPGIEQKQTDQSPSVSPEFGETPGTIQRQ